MVWTLLLLFLIVGTVCSWASILYLTNCKWCSLFHSEGQPHHTHTGKISRVGGVGIIIGFFISYSLFFVLFDSKDNQSLMHFSIFFGALACFALGLIDDFKSVDSKLKFIFQILIAFFAHQSGFKIDHVILPFVEWDLDLDNLSLILTVIWFVSIMNLINLIDGLDGLAGGIGFMLMVLLVVLSIEEGIGISTFLSLGMAGAILGFLIHNFPPARVYMGDSGAYTIGFVIAALSLMNFQKGAVIAALLGPMMALALPILDVTFAIFRRGIQGLPLFRPDKAHIHHQLMRLGLSHKNTVLILYAISLVALFGGILIFSNQGRYFPIFLGFAMVIVIFAFRLYGNSASSIKQLFFESINTRSETQNAIKLSKWIIGEVERIRRAEHLWNDYKWVLKKLGYSKVVISINGEEKIYEYSTQNHDLEDFYLSDRMTLDKEKSDNFIQFWGEKCRFSQRRFDLNCDIAFEAWVLATKRWKELNQGDYEFSGKAVEQKNATIEKARDLYLP
jgi:UDP-GlcNAc:undecaprenyl-phosphate GlcNAc-1-phosphate transferase